MFVTVSCAEGDVGHVYDGKIPYKATRIPVSTIERPRTEIMVNLGNPDLAFRVAMMPNDGVGLARMEFIINEHIGVHPMALVHPDKVTSAEARAAIAKLVRGYVASRGFFHRAACRRRRYDRRRVLSKAGDRAYVGFQDQRICGPLGGR